jgi:hypothetical protein
MWQRCPPYIRESWIPSDWADWPDPNWKRDSQPGRPLILWRLALGMITIPLFWIDFGQAAGLLSGTSSAPVLPAITTVNSRVAILTRMVNAAALGAAG